MTFTVVRSGPAPKAHECRVPAGEYDSLPAGSVVRCDECGQHWQSKWESQYNESWLSWNKIKEPA